MMKMLNKVMVCLTATCLLSMSAYAGKFRVEMYSRERMQVPAVGSAVQMQSKVFKIVPDGKGFARSDLLQFWSNEKVAQVAFADPEVTEIPAEEVLTAATYKPTYFRLRGKAFAGDAALKLIRAANSVMVTDTPKMVRLHN